MPYFCSHSRRKALKEAEEKAALEAKEAAENDFDIGKHPTSWNNCRGFFLFFIFLNLRLILEAEVWHVTDEKS